MSSRAEKLGSSSQPVPGISLCRCFPASGPHRCCRRRSGTPSDGSRFCLQHLDGRESSGGGGVTEWGGTFLPGKEQKDAAIISMQGGVALIVAVPHGHSVSLSCKKTALALQHAPACTPRFARGGAGMQWMECWWKKAMPVSPAQCVTRLMTSTRSRCQAGCGCPLVPSHATEAPVYPTNQLSKLPKCFISNFRSLNFTKQEPRAREAVWLWHWGFGYTHARLFCPCHTAWSIQMRHHLNLEFYEDVVEKMHISWPFDLRLNSTNDEAELW